MTSLTSSTSTTHTRHSPLMRTLESMVKSGEISSSDESTLSSALSTIDDSLKSDAASSAGSTPPSPEDMQKKVSDLIQKQVDAGSLTSDQADELSDVFEKAFSNGPGGAGGPPPGPPPSDSASSSNGSPCASSARTVTWSGRVTLS